MLRGIGSNNGIQEQTNYQKQLATAKGFAELAVLGGAIYGADKFITHKYGADSFRPKKGKDKVMNLIKRPFNWAHEKLGRFASYNTVAEKAGAAKEAVKGFFNENAAGRIMKTVAKTPGNIAKKVGEWALHLRGPLKAVGLVTTALITGKVIHDRAFSDGVGKTTQLVSMMDDAMIQAPPNFYDPESPNYMPTLYEKFHNKI